MLRVLSLFAPLALAATPAAAQTFAPGPVYPFASVAPVDSDLPVPKDVVFKVLFNADAMSAPGKINRTLDSAARFVNMHVAAGVPEANIHVAIVVHGKAAYDLLTLEASKRIVEGRVNTSEAAVAALLAHGVQIYLCGQTAAGLKIARGDLIPGVKLALSAMTANTLLQQQGYTLIPF